MKNRLIVTILNTIADILELQEVKFKPQAYRKAALSIEELSEDVEEVYKRGELGELPGVGESIAEKIEEIIKTGKLNYYEQLKKKIDIDVEALNEVYGLGPKKIKILYTKLGVRNLRDLEKVLVKHKVRDLEGFGVKTEELLWRGLRFVQGNPKRFLYYHAQPVVEKLLSELRQLRVVSKAEIAGSFRRGKETVGDLDILVVSNEPSTVMGKFVQFSDVKEVIAKGLSKSSVRLENGLQVDLRVVKEREFGSALLYFIGNKEHNVELRTLALSKGYTLNEYGLFTLKDKKWVAGRSEEDIHTKLGLQFIPAELRENHGEIKEALHKNLPKLVEFKDFKGAFHNHSLWSDGQNTLLEMASCAENLGWKFISFNDHFGSMGITNPLNERRLQGYLKEIEKVRKKVGIRVFSGVEIDIAKDGKLPLAKVKLKELDVVVASVHTAMTMPEELMTKRVCTAVEQEGVTILGHPTGRLLNEREPIQVNLSAVLETARERGVFLEINSSGKRLDLNGEFTKAGKDFGCMFALSTDAHEVRGLKHYDLGMMMARRGWLEKKDLVNCWDIKKMENLLKR
ncbi:DNA polymerase/3'-5' exonuclease PolX [Candidatus Woesearchaeota archaeon]|nr:DNA polymerase/3'-5' exonuclease PolX [Candidatus Woesearchaeota archaeon]